MRNLSLNDLPDEIIQCILSYASPTSAAAIAQTSRRMDDITNTPLLWRLYCRKHFKYWDARHNITEKYVLPVSLVDWRELFKTRHQTDIAVTKTLEEILACQKGRIQRFNKIINLGYDAKDTLLRHAAVGSDYEDHLARRCVLVSFSLYYCR